MKQKALAGIEWTGAFSHAPAPGMCQALCMCAYGFPDQLLCPCNSSVIPEILDVLLNHIITYRLPLLISQPLKKPYGCVPLLLPGLIVCLQIAQDFYMEGSCD